MADLEQVAPRSGAARNALLWLVLLAQIALPSSYYLWRADREDERFAWRMFSAVRFRSCSVQVTDRLPAGERPVALDEALHASWIGALRRGRERVIERFLASRCAQHEVTASTLLRSCREVDGQLAAPLQYHYACAAQRLARAPSGGQP
jgi:hypothetical protein